MPADEYIKEINDINPNYVPLLADPAIAFRFANFVSFSKENPNLTTIEARKKYIKSFPNKIYYRAIRIDDSSKPIVNGHIKSEGEYNISDKDKTFKLPANDPSVELLVPISLPQNYERDPTTLNQKETVLGYR